MPSDEPEKRSGHSKRRRRSLSLSMASSFKVIDLTDSKPEDSGSRKHGLHENDCQAEGPSKRVKPNRGSEPPMRKDTRMTPEAKRKKLSKVNHCKASRTSNHRELKDKTQALERELENARQAHDDTKRDIQADLEWHAQELKRLQQHCDEKADNARKQEQMVVTAHRDNEKLERKLEDAANVVKALQISCQDKDRELNARAGDIAALQKELDDSDHRSKALKESLGVTNLKLNGKDDIIAALKKEIDGFKRHSGSLEKALAEMKAALKSKDELVAAKQKELDKSEHQSATLKESLGEQERALKASKRDKSDCLKQLASTNEKLSSKELELDQAKTAHDKAREEAEALHLINEAHGHRIQDVRARGQRVKKEYKNNASKLEAEKAELQTQCTELQARLEIQEDKQNQMVTNLHLKLKEARQQSQRHNYKEPDEKIRADFSNLESKIRQFVDKRARPVLNATDRELKTAWPNWSPQLRSFLAAPLLCNMVLEAYVWERLVARIFTPGSKVWVGEVGKSMDKALCLAAGNYDPVVLYLNTLKSRVLKLT
ncbi:hypothetical protein UCDDA912_g08242 [Diaporthe ampelina]|uniref:Uncharacterized protein n=1 Tax=Diaporthe ampelina TaxID=1214573 RepID=A0A0G2FAX1_9PEZI|nr:hypothetical protein UCDDA912_g08242 [Diaporthe ampelina]